MNTENKPKKPKLSLTEKELMFLQSMIAHSFFNYQENASLGSNGDEEDVEYLEKNPHQMSALKKLKDFLSNTKPNKRTKPIPRLW